MQTIKINELPKTSVITSNDLMIISQGNKTYSAPISAIKQGESGVGSMIEHIGGSDIDGYLKCYGSVYNIDDYSSLANHIANIFGFANVYGGDGKTTFGVPKFEAQNFANDILENVTSETDDIYEINSSGSYNDLYPTWHAFNHDVTKGWTSQRQPDQWISLNTKTVVEDINGYSISSRKTGEDSYDRSEAPSSWHFSIKKDGEWVVVDTKEDITFNPGEQKIFEIPTQEPFEEFKINFFKNGNNQNSIISLGNIQLHKLIPLKTTYVKY